MSEVSSIFWALGPWNWLILGGLLLALELTAPGIFLIWFGMAAGLTGLIAMIFEISWQWQFVIFGVLSVAAVITARKYLRTGIGKEEGRPLLNRRAQQHVGKSYVVAEAIKNGVGKVRVGDTLWRAEGPDAKEGSNVTVTGADGTTLLVEPN
ncbi:MAG: NfeD family protein [Hyphomicrobiaceae bacterium]|nr:NfeD family protein [Hyphomicrobiaceae bacterium]